MSSASRFISVVVAMAAGAAVVMACGGSTGTPAGGDVTGTVVPDGGDAAADGPSEAAADAGGLKANAVQGCAADAECQSGHCFIGGNQSFCSVPCTVADQATTCAPPFTGTCNKMGFCKRD